MKGRAFFALAGLAALFFLSCDGLVIGTGLRKDQGRKIIDHADAAVGGITAARIARAKGELVVAYWHTSHGNQLLAGNVGMDHFFDDRGWYVLNGEGGLPLSEPGADVGAHAGDLDDSIADFQQDVRGYLAANPATNVVMASWCGQVSGATQANIANYLSRMSALESEYPGVTFVYMTGHSDGSGDGSDGSDPGNLHLRDRQIRDYCVANGKWLYDFYDIECYDPSGTYFGDRFVNDACDYDSDGDGSFDRNWADDWQDANPGQWWDCDPDHTRPLNGNRKAMAAWQLWCAIADDM